MWCLLRGCLSVCNVENLIFKNIFSAEQLKMLMMVLVSLLHTTIPRKEQPSMPETQGTGGAHNGKGPVQAAHFVQDNS